MSLFEEKLLIKSIQSTRDKSIVGRHYTAYNICERMVISITSWTQYSILASFTRKL